MQPRNIRPLAGGTALAFLSLLLSACLLSAGKFTSSLDIRKDQQFTFAYQGEMYLLPLSKEAEKSGERDETFVPSPCQDPDTYEERDCTDEEIAADKAEWRKKLARNEERRKQESKSVAMFLGGIDPSDPAAAEELAVRLRRQAGWRKVEYKGNGLFEVDFAISGRLDHDFTFPTIERFPMANSFVQIALRTDGTVRIDAPGFTPGAAGMPIGGMMQSMGFGQSESRKSGSVPVIDGAFMIRTDGTVLANNTDEGPQADPAGKRLDWVVNSRTQAAPTALIRLSN